MVNLVLVVVASPLTVGHIVKHALVNGANSWLIEGRMSRVDNFISYNGAEGRIQIIPGYTQRIGPVLNCNQRVLVKQESINSFQGGLNICFNFDQHVCSGVQAKRTFDIIGDEEKSVSSEKERPCRFQNSPDLKYESREPFS